MNTNIEDALNFDPLSAAEKITGKSYKDNPATEALGFLMMLESNKITSDLLKKNNDTHFRSGISEFIAVLDDLRFEQILVEDIPETNDKFYVYWRDGIILKFDTFWDHKSVNSANMFFNYQGDRDALHHCSSSRIDETGPAIYDASRDVREGLRFALEKMLDAGKILPVWKSIRFFWLTHYKDSQVSRSMDHEDSVSYYERVTEDRVAKFPEHVRLAITNHNPHQEKQC